MWFESIGTGLVIIFMLVGFIGTFIPILPGTLLVWLSVLVYAAATKFTVIGSGAFVVITLIALVTGTSSLWMSYLGARTGGASGQSILWGTGGAILGMILFNLFGAIVGYVAGILYFEYRKHANWNLAMKASVSGLAGWGLSTMVEAGGALLIIVIFIWKLVSQS